MRPMYVAATECLGGRMGGDRNIKPMTDEPFDRAENADTLVVLLHGYRPFRRSLQAVANAVRVDHPQSDILAPSMPLSTFSFADVDAIAADVVRQIDDVQNAGHRHIVLIGHSMGAILARKVWLLAHGLGPVHSKFRDAPNGMERLAPRAWADKIDRMVLLAALNRGWMINSALSPFDRLLWTVGTLWGNFCRHVLFIEPVIFAFRRGAPFLTLMRLQCLALERELPRERQPIVVQLLGTSDDLIAPSDNVDLATGGAFYYLEVPEATHHGIVELKEGTTKQGEPTAQGLTEREAFRIAFAEDRETLRQKSLPLADVFDLNENNENEYDTSTVPEGNLKVTHVVFVIHGIRDRGFWTHRIAREVKSYARSVGVECRTVTSTYGYFAMGPFLLPWVRRSKVEWLLDQVVRARSLYPNATFAYIGHSNGTYLLASALEQCPLLEVPRVIFAGSVVRTNFDWGKRIARKQVEKVLNYVATHDWVVAIFPNGLQALGHDVGSAGHDGFQMLQDVQDQGFVRGAHGAALSPSLWPQMARFVIDPQAVFPAPTMVDKKQAWWARAIGSTALFICAVLLLLLVHGFAFILGQFTASGLLWLAALLTFSAAVWALLTKF